jgi:stage V sporulation protein G
MEITEVKLTRVKGDDKLKAFVRVTFDNDFVIKELKIITGKKGMFVAMPSRKLTDHCPKCGKKNHIFAAFCNTCGGKLPKKDEGKARKVYADIAHPINTRCRKMIQERVLEEFKNMIAAEGGNPDEVKSADPDDMSEYDMEDAPDIREDPEDADSGDSDDSDDFSEGIW